MKARQTNARYRWLLGSLCVWLMCAWVVQQPAPAKNGKYKTAAIQPAVALKTKASAVIKAGVDSLKTDPETGLALDKDLMLVKGQCTVCHSSKLILQSHFDREKWVERIRWMQRTQKLWDLGDTEPAVLTYLTKYYGPLKTPFDGRRMPLSEPRWYKETGK